MTRVTSSDLPSRIPENEEEEEAYARGEIVTTKPRTFGDDELQEVRSFADAIALAQTEFETIVEADKAIGTGFDVLDKEEKQQLVGVTFLILESQVNSGDMGEFVSFTAVTEHDRKVIVNDGGTGIFQQVKRLHEKTGQSGGFLVRGGLRRSEYTKEIDGKPTKAVTYYLNV